MRKILRSVPLDVGSCVPLVVGLVRRLRDPVGGQELVHPAGGMGRDAGEHVGG